MERSGRWRPHVCALLGYAAVALAFTWPLAPNIGTHLTGSPAGDTGVYVWNQWVFQHEVLEHRSVPYFTDRIFSLGRRADLSLHNYTAFQNIVALPFVGWLGVVATFNLVYLLMTVLTGYAGFLLVRHITGVPTEAHGAKVGRAPESWLAGLLFAWSPMLATRGGGHFSLVAAAPLAIFMLLLVRTAEHRRLRDAFALGAAVWWAASSDVYYAVYCVIAAGLFLIARTVAVQRRSHERGRATAWTLDVLLFSVGGLVLSMAITGGWQFTFLGRVASMRSLYTPLLAFTALAVARLAWSYRAVLIPVAREDAWRVVRVAAVAGLFCAVLLSPVLYAVGERVVQDRWDSQRIFWRSSPAGVDLLALVLPNPNHPFTPSAVRAWLTPRPDAYYENVASLTFVALVTIAAAWRAGWRMPRLWAGFALVFGALALGPFVHVAGFDTQLPGPWAFLRYAPVIGLARTPGRFTVMLMLAVAVLFGCALYWIGQRWPARRRALLVTAGALLAFELLPAPRQLYSAAIPTVYRHVASAPADARVLELPFGVRDGTTSAGNFTARSQYFQTAHGKRLIGGYLSRVSRRRVSEIRSDGMLDALIWLSEGQVLDPSRARTLIEEGPAFIDRANVAYVVVDRARVSPALREFAIRAYRLQLIEVDGVFELYRPAAR